MHYSTTHHTFVFCEMGCTISELRSIWANIICWDPLGALIQPVLAFFIGMGQDVSKTVPAQYGLIMSEELGGEVTTTGTVFSSSINTA